MKRYLARQIYRGAEEAMVFWIEGEEYQEEARRYLFEEASLRRLWRLYCEDCFEEAITTPLPLVKVARGWVWLTEIYPARLKRCLTKA